MPQFDFPDGSGLARGHLARLARAALIASHTGETATEVFLREYGRLARLQSIIASKGAISMDSGDVALGATEAKLQSAFLAAYRGEALSGQIARVSPWREVEPNVSSLIGGDLGAGWVGEFGSVPLTHDTMTRDSLELRKAGAIVSWTLEAARLGGPKFEAEVEQALIRALAPVESDAMLDPTNDGSADAPAALTYDVTPTALPGTPAADIKALMGDFTGDPRRAVLVTSTANGLAAAAAIPTAPINVRTGGELLGLPLVLNDAAERAGNSNGHIVAVLDPSRVMFAEDLFEVASSESATLTAATSNEERVSLFQLGNTALRILRRVAWKAPQAGSVVFGYSTW